MQYIIYYYYENKELLDIQLDNISEKYEKLVVNSEDDFIHQILNEKNLFITDELYQNISNVFEALEKTDGDIEEDFKFHIKHWISNRSIGELVSMLEFNEIIIPDMQRPFVWDSTKSSRLIESIVMGLPIPPLFLLEIGKNKFEIIDGVQRLFTLSNFISGKSWSGKKNSTSKLSKNLDVPSIRGKSFSELNEEQQRNIRRTMIPLIEFRQFLPNDNTSKYLIFERINTGSEKLSNMQIRKSLAFGDFMKDLYKYAYKEEFKSIFSGSHFRKDIHVEALLRIIAISEIVYGNYTPSGKNGLKDILNEYCEKNKRKRVGEDYFKLIVDSILEVKAIFEKNAFKKVNSESKYEGLLNISILESLIGTMVELKRRNKEFNLNEDKYKYKMKEIYDRAILGEEKNPFSYSTDKLDSMKKRFDICENILLS